MKRRISFLLVFLLLFSLVPGEAWALDVRDSGSCGENVTWTLDSSGTLTISGTGAMTDYASEFDLPWRSWVINAVVIQSGITRIGDYAFYKADLSSISIPTSVTSIGNYAFEFCRKLSFISIPNSVRNIGYYCFFECSGLETVVLPDGLTVIEEDLFGACGKLSSITIPKSVTYIKIGAFDTDIGIKNVYYSGSKVEWDAILVEDYNTYLLSAEIHYQGNNSDIIAKGTWGDDGSISWTLDSEGVLTFVGSGKMSRSGPFNVDGEMEPTEIRSASKKLVIGGGITELDGYIFSRGWGGLTQLIISEGVTTIGELAFNNCYGLEYVSLPSTLSSIGLYAFDLSTIYTSKLKTAGPIGGGYNIEFAWSDTIPDNIFSGMELTDVTLPETVKKIGFMSFYGCSKLSNVNFPSSLKELGSFSFALTSLTDAILPNGINKIGNAVFYECSKLEHVRIPNTITSLPNGARNGGSFTGGVFSNCSSLAEINLPASLLDIGDYSFSGCSNLSEIVFPDNLSRIGASAFSGCTKLSSVVIPDSIRSIEDSSFSNCTNLSEVILSNNLENIGKESFNGSTSIKSIVLPVSIKNIGADAFNYLSAKGVQTSYLSDVYYYGTQEQWNRISFGESTYGISDKVEAANIHYANTVTFSPNGNNGSVNPNTKVVVNGLLYGELPTPSRNGYGFDGWFSSATGGTRITAETLVSATGNHTLYAHWNPNSFTVSFNPNANDVSVSPTSKIVTNGETYGDLPTATRSNYRFDGWFSSASGGTQVTSSTTVNLTGNQTLYAHWTYLAPTYTVTFNPNASDASVSPTSKTVTNGENYGDLPTATRSNYRFGGWFTSASGGTQITSSTTVNLTGNQTLYAHWSVSKTYTVTFLARGGNPNSSTKNVSNGEAYGELPTTVYRNGGKYFDGWYTEEVGGTQILDSTIVNLNEDQTLYAHWADLPSVVPPVVVTNPATDIQRNTAVFNGSVFDDGGDVNLTLEFVYWNKLESATRYTVRSSTSGDMFRATVQNLSPGTTYYFYARAVNSAGEGVGSALSLTTERVEEPVSISVEPTYLSLEIGNVYQLLATVLPATATNRTVLWSSSDSGIVSVDSNGNITPQKSGRAVITATTESNGLKATCTVDVSDQELKGIFDFSEINMASNTGNYAGDGIGFDYQEGGNALMATAYLARWDGAVLEGNDPYPAYDGDYRSHYREIDADYHVQDIYWVPARKNSSDNDEIKAAVMKYGAVYEAFVVYWPYFDISRTNYYYPSSGVYSNGGHAVAVVGWDDNYPASNFTVTPPGNGAFICRNSWGTGSGDGGYFYVSYYDKYFGIRNGGGMVVPSVERNTNYNKVYQYDPLGACSALGFNNATYAANVFPEKGNALQNDETLKAVSFYTYDKNTSYEVYIVTDYQTKTSLQNKGTAVTSGTLNDMGYHTVVLKSPLLLKAGTRFAVIVKLSVSSGNSYVYYEYPEYGYSSNARANADEGYYSSDAMSWTDLTSRVSNANFCIKAFTDGNENNAQLQEAVDNDNRNYESDKVYTLDETLAAGIMVSDEYIEWAQGAFLMESTGDEYLGDIPVIISRGGNDVSFIEGAILPTSYDLRTQGCVTEIRDQGNWGHCWTFATYASLESCLLKKAKTISAGSLSGAAVSFDDFLATVNQVGIAVTGLTLDEEELTLAEGETQRITASFEPANATSTALYWHSGNENVATVDTNGVITAQSAGETDISASTENGVTASCKVTVSSSGTGARIVSVTFSKTSGRASAEVMCDEPDASVYCAGYAANGRFVAADTKPVVAGTRNYEFQIDNSAQYIKVFVLRKDMTPLCEAMQSQ